MNVQIYAFTRIQDALRALELGVDHIGFVAGAYGLVHAELTLEEARAMREAIGARAKSVALTMATDIGEIARMVHAVSPDIVHISSDPTQVGSEAMHSLRRQLPDPVEIMKAIAVAGEESLRLAQHFAPLADYLLLDTKVDGMPGVGATGTTHDWRISRAIVERVRTPVILAGGLSPENVEAAIRVVRPWGVDSNTGTNLGGDPVNKDLDRVAAFVRAARGALSGPG